MQLIQPHAYFLEDVDPIQVLKKIERCGRECYQSDHRVTEDSYTNFVRKIMELGHHSVLEHVSVTVVVTCDRGVSHEIVRHRLASYSQESTRYCNYANGQVAFVDISNGMVLDPKMSNLSDDVLEEIYRVWLECVKHCEDSYNRLIQLGASPQMARSVLPNSLKTSLIWTANLREWRTIMIQRSSPKAHPQMRELMIPLLRVFRSKIPIVFDDIVLGGQ